MLQSLRLLQRPTLVVGRFIEAMMHLGVLIMTVGDGADFPLSQYDIAIANTPNCKHLCDKHRF